MAFYSSINGLITGVKYYRSAVMSGNHIGLIYGINGSGPYGSVTFATSSTTGWQTANFASPIVATAGVPYVVAVYNADGNYQSTLSAFTSNITNAPLTIPANGTVVNSTTIKNGLYVYSTTSPVFPTNTFQSTNYWVDVIFSTNQSFTTTTTTAGPTTTTTAGPTTTTTAGPTTTTTLGPTTTTTTVAPIASTGPTFSFTTNPNPVPGYGRGLGEWTGHFWQTSYPIATSVQTGNCFDMESIAK